jgi:hypothetical protein
MQNPRILRWADRNYIEKDRTAKTDPKEIPIISWFLHFRSFVSEGVAFQTGKLAKNAKSAEGRFGLFQRGNDVTSSSGYIRRHRFAVAILEGDSI